MINISEIVQGDIVQLKPGDVAPATLRLLKAKSLEVIETFIAGNGGLSNKHTFASSSFEPLSQQKNIVFSGSRVQKGTAVGIVVELAQLSKYAPRAKVQKNKSYAKAEITTQTKTKKAPINNIDCVIFDNLQQPDEIIRIIRQLYLQKGIATIFFVDKIIAQHLKQLLPSSIFNATQHDGIAFYTDFDSPKKAKIIASCKNKYSYTLYVHRGDKEILLPRIADISLIIATHARQDAIAEADLVVQEITITKLASILYNRI